MTHPYTKLAILLIITSVALVLIGVQIGIEYANNQWIDVARGMGL